MQYQHQSTPVGLPSTDKVCSALRYRNIDPLGSPTWIHWRLSRWGVVSATDTWCMLVGSCLQCRGASLVCHRQPLVTSYVIDAYLWPCCTPGRWSISTSHDALRLMVDTYEGRKTSWRRPPGRPRNVWLNKIQEDANALLLSTLWRSEIAMGHR